MADRPLNEEKMIGDAELAELLGWNPTTPSVFRSKGKMPLRFYKFGKRIRYRMSDVELYLQSRAVVQRGAVVANTN